MRPIPHNPIFSMENGSNCKTSCCKGCCWAGFIVKLLVVIGGLNWGLIAISPDYNVVTKLLGQWPQAERAVYGLVGLAAVFMLVKMIMRMTGHGCCCKGKSEQK